jgi:hypothetical protein
MTSLITVVLCFSALFSSFAQQGAAVPVQASAVLQKAVVVMGNLPADSTASGSITMIDGSSDNSGTIDITTRGTDQTSELITVSNGVSKATYSRGSASDTQHLSTKSHFSLELAATTQSAVFVLPLLTNVLSSSDFSVEYIDLEDINGRDSHHIRVKNTYASQPDLTYLSEFTTRDIWIDATTYLPIKMSYESRDGGGAAPRTSIDVLYSDYKSVNGVLYPFTIEKYRNGTRWTVVSISKVLFNSGLADSSFNLQ